MKRYNLFSVILLTCLFAFSTYAFKLSDEDVVTVKRTVIEYAKNIDTRNIKGLKAGLCERSTFIHINAVTNRIAEFTYDEYMNAIKEGQIGGWDRNVEIISVDTHGRTAVVKIACKDQKMTETGFLTLMKEGKNWKIISGAFTLGNN